MVGENGALPASETGGVEQQYPYLLGFLTDASANRYPRLKAYCYFEQGHDITNWILDDNSGLGNGGLDAMRILGASPTFSPTPPANFDPH
jgi:hypothetical protein